MESNKQTFVLSALVFLLLALTLTLGYTMVGDRADGSVVSGDAPLLFATMTHMEGDWDLAATNEVVFNRQAAYLRTAMDYAKEYDAVLTFESEIPFAQGMANFDDNVFQEALDIGMGVGTHCDISPRAQFTDKRIIEEVKKRKELIDALVGTSENIGCSGVGGFSDWYAGMVGAGFKYIDGIVGFHYLAMNEDQRPDGWTDTAIFDEFFHYPAPPEDDRYYPFRVNAASFAEDTSGDLVLSSGDIGEVSAIGDLQGANGWKADCGNDCKVDQVDVDAIVKQIRDFDERRDRSRLSKMQVYIPSVKYSDPGIELFFKAMQELQDEDVIEWASQKQVYETFLEWE